MQTRQWQSRRLGDRLDGMNGTDRTSVAGPMACRLLTVVLALALLQTGCTFRDVRQQTSVLESACSISGHVRADPETGGPIVVAVAGEHAFEGDKPIRSADHFVLESAGKWIFTLAPGRYRLLAFADHSGDLEYQSGEPLVLDETLDCAPGQRISGRSLKLAAADADPLDGRGLRVTRERSATKAGSGTLVSLGEATAFGEITTLDHARFAPAVARDSLWRPVDFYRHHRGGIYFLEPHDPDRIPVLMVHGINGSPRVFEAIIQGLDHDRYQPWLYYYPSGISLTSNVDQLEQIMGDLEIRHEVEELRVIAHSMGGLIARAWLLQRPARARVTDLVTISTPWGGHAGAGLGVDHAPAVVPVWRDMAPKSEFLNRLFAEEPEGRKLPRETAKHMLFSYRSGRGGDGVASMDSMLLPRAQAEARSLWGIKADHAGILAKPETLERIDWLLGDREKPFSPRRP